MNISQQEFITLEQKLLKSEWGKRENYADQRSNVFGGTCDSSEAKSVMWQGSCKIFISSAYFHQIVIKIWWVKVYRIAVMEEQPLFWFLILTFEIQIQQYIRQKIIFPPYFNKLTLYCQDGQDDSLAVAHIAFWLTLTRFSKLFSPMLSKK